MLYYYSPWRPDGASHCVAPRCGAACRIVLIRQGNPHKRKHNLQTSMLDKFDTILVFNGSSCFSKEIVLLYDSNPIHCTPLRLKPPLMKYPSMYGQFSN